MNSWKVASRWQSYHNVYEAIFWLAPSLLHFFVGNQLLVYFPSWPLFCMEGLINQLLAPSSSSFLLLEIKCLPPFLLGLFFARKDWSTNCWLPPFSTYLDQDQSLASCPPWHLYVQGSINWLTTCSLPLLFLPAMFFCNRWSNSCSLLALSVFLADSWLFIGLTLQLCFGCWPLV